MKYICAKEYVVKSVPCDHVIKTGEVVILVGYLMGENPVIQLGTRHKPGYNKQLDHVTAVVFEKFDDHFTRLKE